MYFDYSVFGHPLIFCIQRECLTHPTPSWPWFSIPLRWNEDCKVQKLCFCPMQHL